MEYHECTTKRQQGVAVGPSKTGVSPSSPFLLHDVLVGDYVHERMDGSEQLSRYKMWSMRKHATPAHAVPEQRSSTLHAGKFEGTKGG